MAIHKKHGARLEALILQAAADVRRANPHIGAPEQPLSDAEYAEVERDQQELEQVWDEMDRQRGGPANHELAARAVNEDRGE